MRSMFIAALFVSLAFAASPAWAQQKKPQTAELLQKASQQTREAFGQCEASCMKSRCDTVAKSLSCGPTKTEGESSCSQPYHQCLGQCAQSCSEQVLGAVRK